MNAVSATADRVPPRARLPLLLLGGVALVFGVGAGLARLGFGVPEAFAWRAALHGPLMICAFFGTVISLERAVALARPWAYLAPAAAGLGGVLLLFGQNGGAQALALVAALVLCLTAMRVVALQPSAHARTIGLGAIAWLVGSALWSAGLPLPTVALWWIAFLVLTIAGERLELSRFVPTPAVARRVFALIVALAFAGLLLALPSPAAGSRLFSAALLALALWLLRYDIARRTVAAQGLTRYIALCLLSGYFWLAAAALGGLAGGFVAGGGLYDATLHALLLGFVVAMVFGHAPVIFPAILRVAMPYAPLFYLPLLLLHGSLLLRVGGDLAGAPAWRAAGGAGNAAALALFVVVVVSRVVAGERAAAVRRAGR
jgi:hypothetical protein